MKALLFIGLAASALASNAALANADLAKAKNCMACHAVDKKVLGPAYKEVAAKYAGQKDVEGKLAQKIQKGEVPKALANANAMQIGVFDLLADARVQIAGVVQALDAQRDYWLADAALQAELLGRPMAASDPSSTRSGARADERP